jgi:hypothetical protein
VIKSRTIRGAGHTESRRRADKCIGKFIGTSECEVTLLRPTFRCEGNIEIILKTLLLDVNWIHLIQAWGKRLAFMNTEINRPVKPGTLLTIWATIGF